MSSTRGVCAPSNRALHCFGSALTSPTAAGTEHLILRTCDTEPRLRLCPFARRASASQAPTGSHTRTLVLETLESLARFRSERRLWWMGVSPLGLWCARSSFEESRMTLRRP